MRQCASGDTHFRPLLVITSVPNNEGFLFTCLPLRPYQCLQRRRRLFCHLSSTNPAKTRCRPTRVRQASSASGNWCDPSRRDNCASCFHGRAPSPTFGSTRSSRRPWSSTQARTRRRRLWWPWTASGGRLSTPRPSKSHSPPRTFSNRPRLKMPCHRPQWTETWGSLNQSETGSGQGRGAERGMPPPSTPNKRRRRRQQRRNPSPRSASTLCFARLRRCPAYTGSQNLSTPLLLKTKPNEVRTGKMCY